RGEHPRQHTGVHAARPARPSPDGARAPREPELLAALLWRARAVADGWSRMLHFRYARVRKTFPEQRGMSTSVRARLIRVARTLAGSVVGLLVGVTLTLALVTGRARFQQKYIEASDELAGPVASPAVVGTLAGGALGWSGAGVAALTVGSLAGGGVGALIGWAAGSALSDEDADRWAGGTMGAGLGALA